MNPAQALAAWNRKILETYSRRTVASLRAVLPLRLALPSIESFLAENVAKEVAKDALVIRRVAEALADGIVPGEELSRQLLAAGKQIDQAFLARAADFPIGIVIRYEEIEPLRMQRIRRLQGAAQTILEAWHPAGGGRQAIRSCYPRAELERLIHDLMRLYALETQALSRSLRLPGLLVPLRERLAQALYGVMNDAALRLANEVTATVYRPAKSSGMRSLKIASPAGEPVLGLEER
jgi:hypothetical protein